MRFKCNNVPDDRGREAYRNCLDLENATLVRYREGRHARAAPAPAPPLVNGPPHLRVRNEIG